MRLKSSEIKAYRESELERNPACPLCGRGILKEDSALDHDHRSGHVRSVLHRWCNSVLGRIENWSKRVGGIDNIELLENIVLYLKAEKSGIIHPNHGRKRRKKTVKRRRTRK